MDRLLRAFFAVILVLGISFGSFAGDLASGGSRVIQKVSMNKFKSPRLKGIPLSKRSGRRYNSTAPNGKTGDLGTGGSRPVQKAKNRSTFTINGSGNILKVCKKGAYYNLKGRRANRVAADQEYVADISSYQVSYQRGGTRHQIWVAKANVPSVDIRFLKNPATGKNTIQGQKYQHVEAIYPKLPGHANPVRIIKSKIIGIRGKVKCRIVVKGKKRKAAPRRRATSRPSQ